MSRVGGAQEEQQEEEGVDIDSVKCALQAEQDHVQKRTFTNWVNAQLAKHKTPSVVQDLYQDLRDGHQLLDLLEVLSGQQLDHERNRTHPIHWRSNVGTALKFLRTNSVKLVNINVPDIVEGKSTIILGLLWSIISHFQVEKLAMGLERESGQGVPSPPVTSSPTGTPPPKRGRFHSVWKRSAKQALLNWAQEKTRGLPVTIQDLSGSWRNGLAFAAVINALQPGLLDPAEFQHKSDIENLETVFRTAERKLGIPRLLEAQDLAVQKPDEKSIITYLSQFVKYSKELPVGELDTEVEGTPRFLESLGDQSTQDAEHSALQADVTRDFEDSRRQIEACIQGAVLFLQDKGSPGELIAKHQETVRSFDSGVLQRFLDATHKVLTTASPQKSRVVSELQEELCQKWALVHPAVTAHLQRLNSAVEPSGMAHPESGMEAELGTWRVQQQTSVDEGGGSMGAKQHLMTRQLAEGGSAHQVSAGLNPELTGGEHGAREPGELSEAGKLAAREPDPKVLRTSEQCWPGSQEEVDGLVVTLSGREPSGDLARTDLNPRTVAGRGGEGGPARQEPPLFGAVAKDQARGEGPEGPPLPPRLLLPGKWKVQRFPTADIPGTNEPALPALVSLEAWEESAQLQGGSSAGRERAFARAGTDRVPVGAFSEWQQGGGGQTAGEQGQAATVEEPPRAAGRPGSPAGYRVVQPGEWELAAVPDPGGGGGSESQHADPLAAESPVRGSAVALSVGGQPVGAESGQAAPPPTGGLNPEGQARAFPVPPEGSRDHSQAASGGQAQSHSRHGQAAQKTGEPPSEELRPPAVPGDVRAQGGSPVTQRAGAEGISARGEVQGDAHTTGSARRLLQEAGRSPLVKDPTVWDGRAWVSSRELPLDPRTQGDDGVGGGVRWTIPHRAAGETSAGETLDVGSSTVDLSGGHLTQDNADFLAQESFTAQSWPIPDYSQPPRESMDSSHMTNIPAREDCGKSAVATEEESFGIPDLSLTEPRETGLQDHEGREGEGRSSGDAVRRYETAREGLERMLKRLGAWAGTDPHRQPTLSDLREKLHEVQAAQTEVSSCLSVSDAEMMEEQVLPGTDPHLRHTAPRSVREELVLLQQALQRREQSLSSALTALEGLEEQIPLLQNCLLQFQNQPVVLTGSSLKLEPHLQLLKHLQTAIESQAEACEAVSGGGSERAGSLDPEDRHAVCSIARDCARRYQEIGTQAQAAASALHALDGFLQSLRAADPDGRGRLGQEGAAETPTPGSAEEIECLWNRALQLDEALRAARVCLDDGGSSGGRVWCRDLVARLGCRGEAARRQEHLPQEEVYGELCVRQERLVRHLQDIELRAGSALLREATVPAVQGRLDSLKELEHELQQTEVALGELRTLAQQLVSSGSGLAGEAQRRLQAAEEVWRVTASNVQDWKDHYFVLVGFLREFQNHKKDLISSIEKGQDLIPRPSSYMDKAKLRQLMTDIDAVKHEVSTQQEKLDELRNICRHLQSNLRKVMDTGSLPFQREADDLVDQWLDVTERLESYGSRVQRALSLWDGLTECGQQMGERAWGRPDPPGESVCRQEPAALEDEVRVRRQEIQSFHEKAVRIQELLEWEEVPLELQVLESAARKELEQMSQLSDGQQDPGGDPAPTVDRIETGPASLLSQGVEEQDGHFGLDVGVRGQWRSTDGGGKQEELMWSDDNVTPPAEELPQIDAVEREPCPDLGGEDQLPAGPELWCGQGAGTADDTVPMTGGPAQLLQVEAYRGTLSDAGCLVDTLRAEQESTESSAQRIGKSRAGIEEKVREKEEVLQEIAGVSDWMQRTSQLDASDSEHDGASATGPEGVQEALSAQRQVVTELSHRLQSRCTERNTPIPTGLTAHIQQTARALDNMEEKLGARSPQDSQSRELSTRIRETTGRLQGVEDMLQQRSKTVSEAKARQKKIWCEIDEWYSVLSQLDGEVQELAEKDPELAQELMETVLGSFQQHQQVSHLAEQRTALVNKIPECLEVYEQVTQSATSWIQSTEALLSDAIDYTSAKSLSKQLFALQMLAETGRQQQQSLRDVAAGLTELAVMFDTDHMVQQVNRQLDSAAALQQALAQRAAQTQELASEIGAIESEVKTLESKLSKVKAILFSAELGDLPVQEHLTNRQIILENLEEMREVAGVLAECGKSLVLPQGPTGTVEVFTRAARVAMEVPRLQELTTRQSSLLESLLEKLQECDTETERLQKEDDFETQEERLVDVSKQRLSLVSSTQEALNEVTRTFAKGQQSPPPQADQPREPECPQPGNVFGKLSSLLEEDEEEGEGKESAEGTHLPAPPPDVDTQGLEGLDVCRERAGDLERWLESTRELLGAGVWSLTMQRSVEERLRQSQNTLLEIEEQLVHLMDGAPERSPESQPELESLSAQLTALRGSLMAFQAQLEQGQILAQEQETEQSEPACPTEEITQHTKGTWHGDQQRSPGEEPIPSHPSRRDGGDPVPLGVGTPVDPAEGSPPHQQLVATWQLLRQRNKGLQKLLEDSLQQSQGSQVFVTAGELCSVPGLAQPAVEELNMWTAQLRQQSQEAVELATHTQGTTDEDAHLKLETAVQNTALRISDWLDATQEGLCSCRLVPPEEVEIKLKHHQVLLETLEAAHRALTEQTHALGQSATFSCPAALGSLWDLHTRLGLAVRCCSLLTDSLRARVGQFAECKVKLGQIEAALLERRTAVQQRLLGSTGCSTDEQLQEVEELSAGLERLEDDLLELTDEAGHCGGAEGSPWMQELRGLQEMLDDTRTQVGEWRREHQHSLLQGHQYHGLMQSLTSLLEIGQEKVAPGEPLPTRSVADLRTHLQSYKLFFRRLENHVILAEQFSREVPERTVAEHRERWLELVTGHSVLQSEALRHGVHMETTLQVWAEVEAAREVLTEEAGVLSSRLPSVGLLEETEEHVAELVSTFQRIRDSVAESWPRMEDVLRNGKALLEAVHSPELEAQLRTMEDKWLCLRNRVHQELHRLELLLEHWNWFQRESRAIGEWLESAGNQLTYWEQESLSLPPNPESRGNQLNLFLDFRKEVEDRTPSKVAVGSRGRQLLALQQGKGTALRAHLEQLEQRWAQLVGQLPGIQERLQQLQVEQTPSCRLLAELGEWISGTETWLRRSAVEVPALGSSAAVKQALRECQHHKMEMSCRQLAVDFVNQSLLQTSSQDVESDRYGKLELAERLGTLNLRWERVCQDLNSRMQELDLALETWADHERSVQSLASWLGAQAERLKNSRQACSYASVLGSLTDCQDLGELLKVKEGELERLRQTLAQVTREMPPGTLVDSVKTLDGLQSLCQSLAAEVIQLESILMSRRQLWTTYRDSFKEVNGNVVRARYTLDHCSPLSSSLDTSRLLVDKLQALQDTMECGEERWRRFLETSRRLQEECCPPLKGQLEEESRHTERRWTGVDQDVLKRLCSAGEERLLRQQFCAAYSSCQVEVQDAEEGGRQVLTETSAKDGTRDQLQVRLRITQDLANNVKMLQEGLQPVCEAADKLARRLDPSSSAAVQSDVQHLSGRMSRLVELLSLKAQEIQGLLEQHQDFQRHTESLEMVLSRSEEALRSAVPGPETVGQARTEMVQDELQMLTSASRLLETVKRLSAGLALSETEHSRVQELELRWERTRDTAWARCSQLQRAGSSGRQQWRHLQGMVEEALEADVPGNYEQLQERLEAHKVLQVEMALARQTLDAVDGERSPYPTAPGPHSDADTVTRISPGMSPELRCRIQRRGTELRVRASQWLQFSESWTRLQQALGSATARLRAMEGLSRYSLGQLWALLDQLQHEERSLRRHRSRCLHTLDLGGQLLSVADPQTQRVLQEQLGQLRESWESAGARVKDGAARLTHVQEMYSSCGKEAAVLGPKFQDLRKDLKRALPRSTEDLQREQGRLQELEQTLEHWACRLTELSSQTALLGAHLVPSAATGFQEQVTHLEDQCEQLRLASSVRRQEISRGLDQWLLFNSRSKELGDWLKHMEDRVSQSTGTGTGIEEMIDRLQKDCIGEIALWERSRQAVQNLGEGLRDVSEPGRVSEIDSRLQHVHRRWQHLVQLIESRVKNLQETLASVHALDQEMSCLRSWLTHIEAELSKPLVYNACDDQEIERKLAEQQELQRDIDQHGAGVASVLHRCDGLLQDSDTDTECDSLQHQRRSLDRRWRSICAMSVERRMKIEETWRLWQKFLDDYARFEEWLQGAEETAAQPNTSHVPYSLAKEELKKYETFQRQTHESLTQLELINKQYRRLARENRTDTCSRLRHLVSEGNRRWDSLQRRIAAILRRLKHFTNQREEFESCREGILVWLTEMDLQLTNVEHFSESDITDKMRQLNAFQQEITLNTNKIDQLIVSGEQLIQKMEPLDAVDIEEELEELHAYCQEVFGRVARFHQRLTSKHPVCEDQDLRPPEAEDGERAGDTEGELPALTPAPPDGTSQQKSGRETPVSVDSIPLEWDHTVDVGGSSSHDEDDGLVYRPLADVDVTESPEAFVKMTEGTLRSFSGDLSLEPTDWQPNRSAEGDRKGGAAIGQRAAAGLPSDPAHRQGYAKLLSECSGSADGVRRVPADLGDDVPQHTGPVEAGVLEQPSAGLVCWDLLHAQALSKELLIKQNLQQWQQLNSDLDHISAWLGSVAPVLEGARTPQAPCSLAAIQERLRTLGNIQKELDKYKALVVSANLCSREFLQADSDEVWELQGKLHQVNCNWNSTSQGLQGCWGDLHQALLQSQDFQHTTRSLLLWLANCDSRRGRLQPTDPALGVHSLTQHRKQLMELEEELLARQPQVLGLEEVSRQLLEDGQGPQELDAREQIRAVGSRVRLLLQDVAADLQSIDQRLDASSIMSVEQLDFTVVPKASSPLRHPAGLREAPSVSAERAGEVTREQGLSGGRPFLSRVLRAALPLQLLLLLLLLLTSLLPSQQHDYNCALANNFARSLYPMLRYTNGPPPT